MRSLFEQLGIYGLSKELEVGLLCGIMTGDPVLLIGPPGCGKTEAIKALGDALRECTRLRSPGEPSEWFRHREYDSSKLNWEDIVGFPNVKDITENGNMSFISTGTTIWGAHLVLFDELNRCREDRQSNLFEVIRNRTVHGLPTGTKFVYGAMNPHGDTGTEMMSEALVDRFMFYLHFNDFGEMSDSDRVRIIKRIGNLEAVGKKAWSKSEGTTTSDYEFDLNEDKVNGRLAEAGEMITTMMAAAVRHYEDLEADCGPAVAELVNKTIASIRSQTAKDKSKLSISGRRASMIYRSILAYRAIEYALALRKKSDLKAMESSVINAFLLALPHGVSGALKGDEITRVRALTRETIRQFWPRVCGSVGKVPADIIFELYLTEDVYRKISILLTHPVEEMESREVWSRMAAEDKTKTVSKLIYLLKLCTNIIPQSVQVEDFSNEFSHTAGETCLTIKPNQHLAACMEELRMLQEQVVGDPITSFAFGSGLKYYNERVTSAGEAYNAVATLKELGRKLKDTIGSLNAVRTGQTGQAEDVKEPATGNTAP